MTEQSRFTLHTEGVIYEPARDLHWTQDDIAAIRLNHADGLAAIAKLNEKKLGGFDDWRLPTVEELFLLADRTRCNPAIDTEFFPNCASDWYWTSTDDASEKKDDETGHSSYAWIVDFYDGSSDFYDRDYDDRVRAVRGPSRQ